MRVSYKQPISASQRAFTLVEMLVAIAVFALILLMVQTILNDTSSTISRQTRRIDANGAARVALDTLAQDIGTIVTTEDTTLLFKQGNAQSNDKLKFICLSRPDPSVNRARMTLVSYGTQSIYHPGSKQDLPMLMRSSSPLRWPEDGDTQAEEYDLTAMLHETPATDDPVAEGVFRFEIVWLRKDGTTTRDPRGANPDGDDENNAVDADGFITVNLKEVTGMIVSLAAMDLYSLETVARLESSSEQLKGRLRTLSGDEARSGKTPMDLWNQDIPNLTPTVARENARILQRTYLFKDR